MYSLLLIQLILIVTLINVVENKQFISTQKFFILPPYDSVSPLVGIEIKYTSSINPSFKYAFAFSLGHASQTVLWFSVSFVAGCCWNGKTIREVLVG